MRINNISINRNRQENPPNPHQSIQYNRHNPWITVLNTPSKSKIPNTPQHHGRKHQNQPKLWFVDSPIAFCHETGDPVTDGTATDVTDDTEDPGGETDKTDLAGCEVVLRAAEDLG